MDVQTYMHGIGRAARTAARVIARSDTGTRNAALEATAQSIERASERLLAANARDLEAARADRLEEALVDRLTLTEKSIAAMADGVRQVASLPDPIGEIVGLRSRPSGIQVG